MEYNVKFRENDYILIDFEPYFIFHEKTVIF
jgi:hypothetical protein